MTQRYSDWRKSAHSDPNGECVEAGRASDGMIGVRDTKIGRSPILEFSRAEWARFLERTRRGTFNYWRKSRHSDPNGHCVEAGRAGDGAVGVRDTALRGTGPTLEFTREEWRVFQSEIRAANH